MITVSLNNQTVDVPEGASLSQLLEQHPPAGAFAVAINGEFVPRSRYSETLLNNSDEIDLVSPVGGG